MTTFIVFTNHKSLKELSDHLNLVGLRSYIDNYFDSLHLNCKESYIKIYEMPFEEVDEIISELSLIIEKNNIKPYYFDPSSNDCALQVVRVMGERFHLAICDDEEGRYASMDKNKLINHLMK